MGGILGGLSRIAEQAGKADLYKQNRARQLQTQDIRDQIGKAQLKLMQIRAQQEGNPKTTAFRDAKTGALQVLTAWPDGRVTFKSFGGMPAPAVPDIEGMIASLPPDAQKKYGPTITRLAKWGNFKEAEAFVEKVLLASGKPVAEPKPPATKTLMVGGKAMVMAWNPKTGKFDTPVGPAPVSAGFPRIEPINDAKGYITGYNYFRALPNGQVSRIQIMLPVPIPPKPTGAVLTQSQRALMIQPQVQATVDLVKRVANQLGPLKGRWNDFMAGRIGSANKLLAGLQMRLTLFATALMLAHGLKGQGYEETLARYLNAAQSPENLIARIQAADSFLQDYAAATGHGPATAGTSQAPGQTTTGTGRTFEDIKREAGVK